MNNELKQEINFKCSACQTIYQLLETKLGKDNNCSANCLAQWQEILADYHHKEMLNYMNNKDHEENEDEE